MESKQGYRATLRAEIAARLKAAITKSGVSQRAIAKMLGVTSGTVSGWAKGRTQPSLEEFAAICYGLGIEARDVLAIPQGTDLQRLRPIEELSREAADRSAVAIAQLEAAARRENATASERRIARYLRGIHDETTREAAAVEAAVRSARSQGGRPREARKPRR